MGFDIRETRALGFSPDSHLTGFIIFTQCLTSQSLVVLIVKAVYKANLQSCIRIRNKVRKVLTCDIYSSECLLYHLSIYHLFIYHIYLSSTYHPTSYHHSFYREHEHHPTHPPPSRTSCSGEGELPGVTGGVSGGWCPCTEWEDQLRCGTSSRAGSFQVRLAWA